MKQLLTLGLLLLGFAVYEAKAQFTVDTTQVDTSLVITGLDIPWEVLWGPDSMLWVTERYGRVSRIDPYTGMQDVILDHSANVHQASESGMLGMKLHPDFPTEPYVYIVYTYFEGGNIKERMSRFEYNGTALVNETPLIENIPGNTTHDGSRLVFLADGTLLMSTGDAQNTSAPQNTGSLNGKFLRFNDDGTIPSDNPLSGSPVYTWGHRNAQGLLLAPNGKVYSSEHGPNTDDEINIIEKGGNYGWPDVAGYCNTPGEISFCADSNVIEPITAWTPTIATGDILWYDHDAIPEWKNTILLAVLKDKRIIRLQLDASGETVTAETDYFINEFGRIRDLEQGPGGEIYIATSGSSWSNTNPFTHSIIMLKNPNYTPPVDTSVSVKPITAKPTFRMYPNPAQDVTVVEYSQQLAGAQLSMFNATGELALREELDASGTHQLALPNSLAKGIYMVNIATDEANISRQLILE